MTTNAILIVLDGWGSAEPGEGNAITSAPTPWVSLLQSKYPSTLLNAHGPFVGLDEGRMGSSEVGHLTIGAGRVVETDLVRICREISQEKMNSRIGHIESDRIHVVGIVSDGGVHGHIDIVKSVVRNAKGRDILVHAICDGRDSEPKCFLKYFEELERFFKEIGKGRVVSVSGRYYSMDRDKREERIDKAYKVMANGEGLRESTYYDCLKPCDKEHYEVDSNEIHIVASEIREYINEVYESGCSDEFIPPRIFDVSGVICKNEPVIFTNFRADRMRQLVRRFEGTNPCFTMTEYDSTINAKPIFTKTNVKNTLAEVISRNNLTQVHVAESEKYAHVTYFLNGGLEKPFDGESRFLIPSPKVSSYDLIPEMRVEAVADEVINGIKNNKNFIVCNFAPPDMVGHTGNFIETCKAVTACDQAIGRIYEATLENDYVLFITSDHGNAENMKYPDGKPCKTHTVNKVPFIACTDMGMKKGEFCLSDIAPTILTLMGLDVPKEMTGKNMLEME